MVAFSNFDKGNITAATQNTPWRTVRKGAIFTLSGTFTGTMTLQRRGVDGVTNTVTDNTGTAITFTKPGTYSITPYVPGDYSMNCSAYTSGTIGYLQESY